jgi:hypothetical protein
MKSFDRRCTFSFLSDAHFLNLSGGAHFQSFVRRCTFSIFCHEVHIFNLLSGGAHFLFLSGGAHFEFLVNQYAEFDNENPLQ